MQRQHHYRRKDGKTQRILYQLIESTKRVHELGKLCKNYHSRDKKRQRDSEWTYGFHRKKSNEIWKLR
jgi:hypothetical protein